MANYVLIHGGRISTETWNTLAGRNDYPPGGHLGGECWDGTVSALRARNHRVFAPTLLDENSSNLTGHIDQVCTLMTENDLKEVIMVAHSYGGMVITGVAARMTDRIRRLVYLDAALPILDNHCMTSLAWVYLPPLSAGPCCRNWLCHLWKNCSLTQQRYRRC